MTKKQNEKVVKVKKIALETSVKEYVSIFKDIKKRVQQAQVKAAFSVNKELLMLYWEIGRIVVEMQQKQRWGTRFIEQLANDLKNEFPGVAGFSRSNIFRMQAFYKAYEKVSEAPRQLSQLPIFDIPWWHNVILLTKLEDNNERLWYAVKTIQYGWSSTMLEHWISTSLYHREGKALTNFKQTLPAMHSDLAQQSLKDPYLFDFLTLHKEHLEQDLEQGLIAHIQKFLLELGQGFAFVGRQVHLEVENKDFYIDLLFYHTRLRCYVVVELKTTDFDPRDTGQISFYLAAVDAQIKHVDDQPTIGLLLCKSKSKLIVEYALRSNIAPIGIASYETKLVESLPKNLKSNLPTIEEIEAGLAKEELLIKKAQGRKTKKKK
jgi:predicted nuclease of restriction endonuclease-like (RecB) superfamily